ncbi:MAG: LysR family transcriptional regulator [Alphaproteobacteria bacterium]|nr:LysR family transcriptional regulator [Alphaproteobacteria bacterium]
MPDLALDLRYLKYAIIVAEHGSFRRAADILNLSQSTVSRRILLLENRLGTPLFERNRTGTRPTLVGQRFLREAAVGAEHLRRAVNEMALAQRGDVGELRIGLMASLASGFLADLLDTYHRRFPNVDVKVEEATSQANAAGVLNGRLDAAFIPGMPRLPGCEAKLLWDEQIFVAVPDQHRLAAHPDVDWEDLREETFLVSADGAGPEVEGILVRQLSGLGFHPKILVQRVGRENLMNLVGKAFGLTLAANSTVGVSYPGVTFVPVRCGSECVSSSVVWSAANVNAPLKQLLELSVSLARQRQQAFVRVAKSTANRRGEDSESLGRPRA